MEKCQPLLSPTSGSSWVRWTASPRQALNCPRQVWKLLYRLPGMQGLLGRDVGRDRFACGCKCFPCKHGLCQSVLSHTGSGAATSLPRMPTTARPWVGQLWGPEWHEISGRRSAPSWVLSSLQPGLARPRKERMLKVRGWLQSSLRPVPPNWPRNMTLLGGAGGCLSPEPHQALSPNSEENRREGVDDPVPTT